MGNQGNKDTPIKAQQSIDPEQKTLYEVVTCEPQFVADTRYAQVLLEWESWAKHVHHERTSSNQGRRWPRVKDVVNGECAQEWWKSMKVMMNALKRMPCCNLTSSGIGNWMLHTNLVLCRKIEVKRTISERNARLMVCWNEEVGFQEDRFFPVAEFTVLLLNIHLVFQVRRKRHLSLENTFRSGYLRREVFAELSAYINKNWNEAARGLN